jgi:hypothetical protein
MYALIDQSQGALIDLHNDRTFRDDRRFRVDMRGVFLNPVGSSWPFSTGHDWLLSRILLFVTGSDRPTKAVEGFAQLT